MESLGNRVIYIYILEELCNYILPFLKIPLLDFDQTFRDGGDPPRDGFMPGGMSGKK